MSTNDVDAQSQFIATDSMLYTESETQPPFVDSVVNVPSHSKLRATVCMHEPVNRKLNICLITTEWNEEYIEEILKYVYNTANEYGNLISFDHIVVAGSGEFPATVNLAINSNEYDGILAIGIIFHGETNHGMTLMNTIPGLIRQLSMNGKTPVTCGILDIIDNDNKLNVLRERYNSGAGWLYTLLRMINIHDRFNKI